MSERHLACTVDELEPGTSMTVKGPVPAIALHRTESGAFFATADTCTHEEWSLGDEGDLEGDELVCPLHMARFDLATGKALCLPATLGLATYDVVVEAGQVFVVTEPRT
ncbi:non-heme iron oxygenase ferredoxin subunit [Pseudonocardia pini]|uniref:non-heme iron oxygenase ferredoxin subunit n=1 Tax=Pseudonocardia pini TaxID=2758030 RepID=UPI0028A70E0E|nr:non-heme iron oxygenase ferredoxin subunit [Pseudonocardia pini]